MTVCSSYLGVGTYVRFELVWEICSYIIWGRACSGIGFGNASIIARGRVDRRDSSILALFVATIIAIFVWLAVWAVV